MHSLFCQEGREKVVSAGGIEAATASIIRRYPRIFQVGVFFVFGFAMFASFRKDPGWHECESQKRRVRRLWGKLETGRREPQKLRSTTVARSCRCCKELQFDAICARGRLAYRGCASMAILAKGNQTAVAPWFLAFLHAKSMPGWYRSSLVSGCNLYSKASSFGNGSALEFPVPIVTRHALQSTMVQSTLSGSDSLSQCRIKFLFVHLANWFLATKLSVARWVFCRQC